MAILVVNTSGSFSKDIWQEKLSELLPDFDLRFYPDVGNLADIKYAIVWKPPNELLASLSNLKAILSLGAGVDHILQDKDYPKNIPIVRLVDENLSREMSHYVLHWVFNFHYHYYQYQKQQSQKIWRIHKSKLPENTTVGIMGFGTIGMKIAKNISNQGFKIIGWGARKRPKQQNLEFFYGNNQLNQFLSKTNILVNTLPLTQSTKNLINKKELSKLPNNSFIINVARGEIINEDDLLLVLDENISAVVFDVFKEEPLSKESLLWQHPRVYITPHIAGQTNIESASKILSENIKTFEKGQIPTPIYNSKLGY